MRLRGLEIAEVFVTVHLAIQLVVAFIVANNLNWEDTGNELKVEGELVMVIRLIGTETILTKTS